MWWVRYFLYIATCVSLKPDLAYLDDVNPFITLRINEENLPYTAQDKYPERYFNQIKNHSSDIRTTYKQRYFVNEEYYKPGGPAFLFIGGESKISPVWVWWGQLAQAAKKHNGIIFALEHRFYGKSFPTADLSTKSLELLSSDQALKDIAYFISNAPIPKNKATAEKKTRPRWIVAGGSYPGNLAAWARLLYPDLIYGAVASSAPVYAKENFYEYDLQVSASLIRHGGPLCANYFHQVFTEIDKELLSGDPTRSYNLKKLFNMQNLTNELFAMNLDFISGLVQYNNPSTTNYVTRFCRSLSLYDRADNQLKEFADIVKRYNIADRFQKALQLAGDEDLPDENSLFRQWLYQCCTEFGYWQIAPPKLYKASRSRAASADDWDKLFCGDVYGSEYRTGPHTKATNHHYKGRENTRKRIFWVNGELDPWRPLSVVKKPRHHPSPYVIYNASHAMDLGGDSVTDWNELKKAKKLTQKHITKWLSKKQHHHSVTIQEEFHATQTQIILAIVSLGSLAFYFLCKLFFPRHSGYVTLHSD